MESVFTSNRDVGSNPTLSATYRPVRGSATFGQLHFWGDGLGETDLGSVFGWARRGFEGLQRRLKFRQAFFQFRE